MHDTPKTGRPKQPTRTTAGREPSCPGRRERRARQAWSAIFLRLLAALAFAGTAAVAIDVHAQDIERGRQLYENHCQGCHSAAVHGREKRVAFSVSDLRAIVDRWQRHQKLNWSAEDIEDVVQYLGTTRYFFIGQAEHRSPR